jgi:hypothetical protein
MDLCGHARPSVGVVQACFAPLVWILDFLIGFALRSLSLCRVFALAPGFVFGWRVFIS